MSDTTEFSYITINFYHSNFCIKAGEHMHLWENAEEFLKDTGFPFKDTVRMLSYEPDRNFFSVETPDGKYHCDTTSDEFKWCQNNLPFLAELTERLAIKNKPVVTMGMVRTSNLYSSDWILQRHQEEKLLGIPQTYTDDQVLSVLQYRQLLREFTKFYDLSTPADQVSWPVSPILEINNSIK